MFILFKIFHDVSMSIKTSGQLTFTAILASQSKCKHTCGYQQGVDPQAKWKHHFYKCRSAW